MIGGRLMALGRSPTMILSCERLFRNCCKALLLDSSRQDGPTSYNSRMAGLGNFIGDDPPSHSCDRNYLDPDQVERKV
jgi:hypothetical protein